MSGIQKIQNHFAKEKAFVGYLTAGDGGIKKTLEAFFALIAAGVNMLEIGVPFSDPIADGPVIQRASNRALTNHTTLKDILWLSKEIRKKSDIPIILFSYLNPILAAVHSAFFQDAKKAGIDGMLIVDCPIEESMTVHQHCLAADIAPIYVIAPTTTLARMRYIDQQAKGFLYYACRKGTTGIQSFLPDDFIEKMQVIKKNVTLPVITGFGISTLETAKTVLQQADGFVVGSLFVKALEDGMTTSELKNLASRINPLTVKP